jgi:hypothetical protein
MVLATVLVLALLAGGFALYAAKKSDVFYLASSIDLAVPPETVRPYVGDLRRWTEWSPYEKLDPKMQKKFAAVTEGVGATYEWSGNSKAGAGRIEITGSTPGLIDIQLAMFKPFPTTNHVQFIIEPRGMGTHLIWSMSGPATFSSKVLGILFTDKLITRQFTEGLRNLKALAERR